MSYLAKDLRDDSSPAVETCTSAQKNELAGSHLLGCQGQPNQALGAPHLPPGMRARGAGPGGLDLKGWRADPPQGLCPKRHRQEETGSREQARGGGDRDLQAWGAAATPSFLAPPGHTGARLLTPIRPLGISSFFSYLAPLPVPRAPGE